MQFVKPILKTALVFYGLLVFIVFALPVAFTACSPGSLWCAVMYWITESGGWRGTTCIVLISGLLYATSFPSLTAKAKTFFLTVLALGALLASFALLNERLVKTAIRIHRPSHTYIIRESKSTVRLDSVYLLPAPVRRKFYQDLIIPDTITFKGIDPRILNHWIDEEGYSFPSGHSFNVFLLGSILAFFIYHLGGKRYRILYFIPLLWAMLVALSRVAIGVHSAWDVSAGGALGVMMAYFVLAVPAVQGVALKKEKPPEGL
jgi:phosphatidylglycerophosphatase B